MDFSHEPARAFVTQKHGHPKPRPGAPRGPPRPDAARGGSRGDAAVAPGVSWGPGRVGAREEGRLLDALWARPQRPRGPCAAAVTCHLLPPGSQESHR